MKMRKRDLVASPFMKQVLQEWKLYLVQGADATAFATFYLELMRDDQDAQARKEVTMFLAYARPRTWKWVFRVIKPALEEDVRKAFESPAAAEFYEGWRACVTEEIRKFWEDFLKARSEGLLNPKDWSPRGNDAIPRERRP
jgi:uncharacterized protein with von Willebrand factor type A (vWA) domain